MSYGLLLADKEKETALLCVCELNNRCTADESPTDFGRSDVISHSSWCSFVICIWEFMDGWVHIKVYTL